MPLNIPWLTDTIKKRGVRYLLHHYLGQFFLEKLTLEQLSIDIYDGIGSIMDLALDVDGLNEELDFIPFRFLDGCSIGQIKVEVPWTSLSTEACKVELDDAKFVCRLKVPADKSKSHCTESTLLSRSLMTSSMQMAEDIVTTEDDDEYESPSESMYRTQHVHEPTSSRRKEANQMFEGLETFALLIDSVLRRTKLTARNTLFQIQTNQEKEKKKSTSDRAANNATDCASEDESNETTSNSDQPIEADDDADGSSNDTVEFMIKFFRCEEIMDNEESVERSNQTDSSSKPISAMPETITKLLTLEDVEMRIGGTPVSNLIGKHTIMIKFNGHKSEISVFSGSPLLAVISHQQLRTFFNVFDTNTTNRADQESAAADEKNQKMMSPEDYAKIENQLLESASWRNHQVDDLSFNHGLRAGNMIGSQNGRRWVETGGMFNTSQSDYHCQLANDDMLSKDLAESSTPTLDNLEAFSCELKLPGIWLCILRDGESLPPLIKPYADSITSFQAINKYIDDRIKVPHIRLLALKVALNMTPAGINLFLGDLDIAEHLKNDSMSPTLHILHNDAAASDAQMNFSRYRASIVNFREISIDLLTKTRFTFDPIMIDRIVYDYKLIDFHSSDKSDDKRAETTTSSRFHHDTMNSNTTSNSQLDLDLTVRGEQFKIELLCPIPDLRPEAESKTTQLRPQSFVFDFKDVIFTCRSGVLDMNVSEMVGYVKTQPQQSDLESIRFIECSSKKNDRISILLEPSPSNLDDAFPSEVEQVLNESSMYDSIYVGQSSESRIPTEAFQTKRKVVRPTSGQQNNNKNSNLNDCDNEKILTPGDRQHLTDYLAQTVMSTKLSLQVHLPICDIEFEDKEQLDLIYNRFGNDFVFWQPKALTKKKQQQQHSDHATRKISRKEWKLSCTANESKLAHFKQPLEEFNEHHRDEDDDEEESERVELSDQESEVSFHSLSGEGIESEMYDNEVTCKVEIDELSVTFNHQSCSSAMKQEISLENLLLGVIIDVNKKPNTILSLVADNLELSNNEDTVLEGNKYGDDNSNFLFTAEIKRPTKSLKDIKLAIQLINCLFNDLKAETFKRFWQSINVTDEPILGYVAPKIVTELHIDLLNTAVSLVRDNARPALVNMDELYLTSMVVEQTSQVMIRLIADEISLYLKRDRQGQEVMKNYICLLDSGLIDLDVKFYEDGKLEFGVINNVITVRVCQDSLSALCKLFDVLLRTSQSNCVDSKQPKSELVVETRASANSSQTKLDSNLEPSNHLGLAKDETGRRQQMNLLEDAMNDFSDESEQESDSQSGSSDDCPPKLQQATSSTEIAETSTRDPNACLLDESIPFIGDLFSPPLVPASQTADSLQDLAQPLSSSEKAIDESGFFVIGDDDVGAGIMNRSQHEPVVRRLIDRPINIIENHFKMTRPRTIPEMLAASIERYVLEEMTLIVNLYGGRDFDDEARDEPESSATQTTATNSEDHSEEYNSIIETATDGLPMRSRSGSNSLASPRRWSQSGRKQEASNNNKQQQRAAIGGRRKHLSEGSRLEGPRFCQEPKVRFGDGAVNLWESLDLMSSPDFLSQGKRAKSQLPMSSDSKLAGGIWRETDVCIQLTFSKVKLLYELAGRDSPISWRFMLFIEDVEIRDRVQASDINKMLYEYCSESMPKRNTQLLTIKNVATLNPSDGCEECDLRISLKPLRLNIDQDSLLFLIEFFSSLSKSLSKQQQQSAYASSSSSGSNISHQATNTNTSSGTSSSCRAKSAKSTRSSPDGEGTTTTATTTTTTTTTTSANCSRRTSSQSGSSRVDEQQQQEQLPTHCHTDSLSTVAGQRQPIYIKSFTFSPDVPIRVDYHAKHLAFEQGAVAGILMGFAHLDHSELVLRRVQAKHGMRGLDRVLLFTLNSWLNDIKRNQLPSILQGVGPMHSVIQLFQGMRDLIWMPIDHYRKDRRLVRGLQRGASSFSSSTAMAAINLINRFISIVQCTAQIAHDIVTPPGQPSCSVSRSSARSGSSACKSAGCSSKRRHHRHHHFKAGSASSSLGGVSTSSGGLHSANGSHQVGINSTCLGHNNNSLGLNQPRNFCEGVTAGFNILKEGLNDTARNVAIGMQAEDVPSAVGEFVRQIPSTLLSPIISATEGAQNVLVGIRNQIAPDARREDHEKWKRRVRGK